MGMDLYKYEISEGGDDWTYIGEDLCDKDLLPFSNFEIIINKSPNADIALSDAQQAFNTTITPKFWDFSEEVCKPYVLYLNKRYEGLFKSIDKRYDESNDDTERSKIGDEENELIDSINSDAKNYIDFNCGEFYNTKYGSVYILPNLQFIKNYYIKGTRSEKYYFRKPFRHFSTPPKSQNGTTTLYVDNFTGTTEDTMNALYNKAQYSDDDSIIVFTSKHNADKEFLDCVSPDYREELEKMFPLKENEIISIDW